MSIVHFVPSGGTLYIVQQVLMIGIVYWEQVGVEKFDCDVAWLHICALKY